MAVRRGKLIRGCLAASFLLNTAGTFTIRMFAPPAVTSGVVEVLSQGLLTPAPAATTDATVEEKYTALRNGIMNGTNPEMRTEKLKILIDLADRNEQRLIQWQRIGEVVSMLAEIAAASSLATLILLKSVSRTKNQAMTGTKV